MINCGFEENSGTISIQVTKLDSSLVPEWSVKINDQTSGQKRCTDVVESPDGSGYVLTGYILLSGVFSSLAIKVDRSGNLLSAIYLSNTLLLG